MNDMSEALWWQTGVIYQNHPLRCPTNSIVLNFSDHHRNLAMPSQRTGTLGLGTSLDRSAEAIADKPVLGGHEGVIIELA